jgi:predicted membrane protein
MSIHYNWLVLVPLPFLLIAIVFCIYPTCASWWLKRSREKKLMAEFMKFDKIRSESQQSDRSSFMQTKSSLIKDSADDEEPYEIDSIEQIGDFFGDSNK